MVHTTRFVQWEKTNFNSEEARAVNAVKHWQSRYELGTGLLLSEHPEAALKAVQKQWRKLTRQLQQNRQDNTSAEDILQTTRAISRMQRVKFSSRDPLENPNANFYVANPAELTAMPSHCYTLYSFTPLPTKELINLLAPDALVVAYKSQRAIPGLLEKAVLETQFAEAETQLTAWLEEHDIAIDIVGADLEKANQALDTLLSSSRLQAEFLNKVTSLLHTLQLASPLKLRLEQESRVKAFEQLERHVRILSPAFLSDHIIDSEADDSFLLRDLSKKSILTLEALREFITQQYHLGHANLAAALEQKSGFIRV